MEDCTCKGEKSGKKMYVREEPVHLDAYALRAIAEAAASARGSDGEPYFVIQEGDPGTGKLRVRPAKPGEPPPTGTIMVINTPPQVKDRPAVIQACITPKGGNPCSLLDYDAVFWTEAAVEKFVFPYYVSKSMWKSKNHLAALSDTWYHRGPKPDAGAAEEQDVPFAMGHVPDSDFVPLTQGEGGDIDVLFMRPNGTVYAKSLMSVIQEREARGLGTEDL